jgi:hypothetical protein
LIGVYRNEKTRVVFISYRLRWCIVRAGTVHAFAKYFNTNKAANRFANGTKDNTNTTTKRSATHRDPTDKPFAEADSSAAFGSDSLKQSCDSGNRTLVGY